MTVREMQDAILRLKKEKDICILAHAYQSQAVLEVADFVKKTYHLPTRINTNGLSDLIWNKNTAPDYAGKIDVVSISLNTPNKTRYYELTRNKFGIGAFDAMLKFAENVSKYVKKTVLTTVSTTITPEEEKECAAICERLGVTYRIRPFE